MLHIVIPALLLLYGVYWILVITIIPFYKKEPIPSRLPRQVEHAITQLEKDSSNSYEYLRNSMDYLLSTVSSQRIKTITRLNLAFEKSLAKLFRRRGFMHCTQLVYLLRVLLVRSKFFDDDTVRNKIVFLNFVPHIYLQVKIAGQWYDADPGADQFGIPLGNHAWGFR